MLTGRPTKLTDAVASEICERLEKGVSRADAARLSGIHPATLQAWLARGRDGEEPYASFSLDVERACARARENLIDQVQLYATADQPHSWRASLELYKELMGSSRGAEKAKAQEEVTREILDRLRQRLDPETFRRVAEALCDEGGDELPGRGTGQEH